MKKILVLAFLLTACNTHRVDLAADPEAREFLRCDQNLSQCRNNCRHVSASEQFYCIKDCKDSAISCKL